MGSELNELETVGCPACRSWIDEGPTGLPHGPEVTASFRRDGEYFSVHLIECDHCQTVWLLGYTEDFSGKPIDAEFGNRWWTLRALTAEQVEEIEAAQSSGGLELRTFASHRPGVTWGN